MSEWAVGHWVMGVTSFQKIYGLYGLKHTIVEISGDVTKVGRTDNQTRKDRATQLLNRETLSFAIFGEKSSPKGSVCLRGGGLKSYLAEFNLNSTYRSKGLP